MIRRRTLRQRVDRHAADWRRAQDPSRPWWQRCFYRLRWWWA